MMLIGLLHLLLCSNAEETSKQRRQLSTTSVLLPYASGVVRDVNNIHDTASATIEAYGGCFHWSVNRPDIVLLGNVDIRGDPTGLLEGNGMSIPIGGSSSYDQCISKIALYSWGKDGLDSESAIITATDNQGTLFYITVALSHLHQVQIITKLKSLSIGTTEELSVQGLDRDGNVFDSLQGLSFSWAISDESVLTGFNTSKDIYISPMRAQLHAKGLGSELYYVEGRASGRASVSVELRNLQIADSVALTVQDELEVDPRSGYVMPGSKLVMRLYRNLKNEREPIDLPSKRHVWSTDEPASINGSGVLCIPTELKGLPVNIQVNVDDTLTADKSIVRSLGGSFTVVNPTRLVLSLTSNKKSLQYVQNNKNYTLHITVMDAGHNKILGSNTNMSVLCTNSDGNSSTDCGIVKTKRLNYSDFALETVRKGDFLLKVSLSGTYADYDCSSKAVKFDNPITGSIHVSVVDDVSIKGWPTAARKPIIVPKNEQYPLPVIGGSGEYEYSVGDPSIAVVRENGTLVAINHGFTELNIIDRHNDENRLVITVVVAHIAGLYLSTDLEAPRVNDQAKLRLHAKAQIPAGIPMQSLYSNMDIPDSMGIVISDEEAAVGAKWYFDSCASLSEKDILSKSSLPHFKHHQLSEGVSVSFAESNDHMLYACKHMIVNYEEKGTGRLYWALDTPSTAKEGSSLPANPQGLVTYIPVTVVGGLEVNFGNNFLVTLGNYGTYRPRCETNSQLWQRCSFLSAPKVDVVIAEKSFIDLYIDGGTADGIKSSTLVASVDSSILKVENVTSSNQFPKITPSQANNRLFRLTCLKESTKIDLTYTAEWTTYSPQNSITASIGCMRPTVIELTPVGPVDSVYGTGLTMPADGFASFLGGEGPVRTDISGALLFSNCDTGTDYEQYIGLLAWDKFGREVRFISHGNKIAYNQDKDFNVVKKSNIHDDRLIRYIPNSSCDARNFTTIKVTYNNLDDRLYVIPVPDIHIPAIDGSLYYHQGTDHQLPIYYGSGRVKALVGLESYKSATAVAVAHKTMALDLVNMAGSLAPDTMMTFDQVLSDSKIRCKRNCHEIPISSSMWRIGAVNPGDKVIQFVDPYVHGRKVQQVAFRVSPIKNVKIHWFSNDGLEVLTDVEDINIYGYVKTNMWHYVELIPKDIQGMYFYPPSLLKLKFDVQLTSTEGGDHKDTFVVRKASDIKDTPPKYLDANRIFYGIKGSEPLATTMIATASMPGETSRRVSDPMHITFSPEVQIYPPCVTLLPGGQVRNLLYAAGPNASVGIVPKKYASVDVMDLSSEGTMDLFANVTSKRQGTEFVSVSITPRQNNNVHTFYVGYETSLEVPIDVSWPARVELKSCFEDSVIFDEPCVITANVYTKSGSIFDHMTLNDGSGKNICNFEWTSSTATGMDETGYGFIEHDSTYVQMGHYAFVNEPKQRISGIGLDSVLFYSKNHSIDSYNIKMELSCSSSTWTAVSIVEKLELQARLGSMDRGSLVNSIGANVGPFYSHPVYLLPQSSYTIPLSSESCTTEVLIRSLLIGDECLTYKLSGCIIYIQTHNTVGCGAVLLVERNNPQSPYSITLITSNIFDISLGTAIGAETTANNVSYATPSTTLKFPIHLHGRGGKLVALPDGMDIIPLANDVNVAKMNMNVSKGYLNVPVPYNTDSRMYISRSMESQECATVGVLIRQEHLQAVTKICIHGIATPPVVRTDVPLMTNQYINRLSDPLYLLGVVALALIIIVLVIKLLRHCYQDDYMYDCEGTPKNMSLGVHIPYDTSHDDENANLGVGGLWDGVSVPQFEDYTLPRDSFVGSPIHK